MLDAPIKMGFCLIFSFVAANSSLYICFSQILIQWLIFLSFHGPRCPLWFFVLLTYSHCECHWSHRWAVDHLQIAQPSSCSSAGALSWSSRRASCWYCYSFNGLALTILPQVDWIRAIIVSCASWAWTDCDLGFDWISSTYGHSTLCQPRFP